MKNFSADIQLIIECCQASPSTNKIKKLLSCINDWDNFINLAYAHGVFPLLYQTLKHTDYKNLINEDIHTTMKLHYMNIVKENMLMTVELIKVIKLLEENGIEAIAFKGPTLAQMAYGDITLRQYADLDILVDEKMMQKIYNILIQNNYTSDNKLILLNNSNFYLLENDFIFYSPNKSVTIEIHWRLFRKNIAKHQKFSYYRNNTKNIILNKNNILTLSIEQELSYLCLHGAKHAWERIEWINDIYYLINNNSDIIKWSQVIHHSKELEGTIALFVALNIIKSLYSIKIPKHIETNMNSAYINKLTDESIHLIQNHVNDSYVGYYKTIKFQSKLIENRFKRLQYIFTSYFAITRNDYIAFPLPSYLNLLYYIVKPIRIFYKILKNKK